MIISARPYPSIKTLFSSGSYLDLTHYEFQSLGREALLDCMIQFGLQSGDNIIIPAYICESTIKPLQSYGFNLILIDINQDLTLPIEKIKALISKNKIKVLLLVHYFGLTQEIDEVVNLCHKYGVKVIEDVSHGFMSQLLRDKKSVISDAEIFSMRKNLPVVDGGALRMNNIYKDITKKRDKKNVSIIIDIRYLLLRFLEKILTRFGINIYSQFIGNFKNKFRKNSNTKIYNHSIYSHQVSWQLSKYLGSKAYLKSSQKKITQNFRLLSLELNKMGFRFFTDSLAENIIPQACIIYDDKGGLVEYLRLKGIGAWRWPDDEMPDEVKHNPSLYPNTIFFDKKLTLVPIHQSLGSKEINHIIQVLSRWHL